MSCPVARLKCDNNRTSPDHSWDKNGTEPNERVAQSAPWLVRVQGTDEHRDSD